ncbi:sensor histidine kinase [Labedaea rhizosphaerae]|nr:histidine kinase [Labedaea rhizosphaerae]
MTARAMEAGETGDGRPRQPRKRSWPRRDPAVEAQGDYGTLAPRLSRGVLIGVFAGFCAVTLTNISTLPDLGVLPKVFAVLDTLALLALQLLYFSRDPIKVRTHTGIAMNVLQAALAYLPLLVFHHAWTGMPGFVAGTALLVLPAIAAWSAFGLVVLSMTLYQASAGFEVTDTVYIFVSTSITGLVVYGLTRLSTLVKEVNAARSELAEMAVARERLRFARDLHDLLGYSLSAITLKSELTHRLVAKDPERAREELSEVLAISRQALADVRSVASGYRELSLEDESRSARSVLAAADVDVQMHMNYDDLPARVTTVLATVLREGVTNVLRHSKAEQVKICVRQNDDQVAILVVNDGVPDEPMEQVARSDNSGSGIHNLSDRVTALGGLLSAGVGTDGRFRLTAAVPLRPGVKPDLVTEAA